METETTTDNSATTEYAYRRFLDGDESAFEEIVSLYEDDLYAFIKGIVNDNYEAKHLTVQAFSELALSKGRFLGKSSIKTYIFAIAKNLAYKQLKMQKNEQHISFEGVVEVLYGVPGPHDLLEQEETNELLHNAISELNNDYRAVLELLYFEDMSYTEAGRLMKKSVKQIDNLATRAKASLKKALESSGYSRHDD